MRRLTLLLIMTALGLAAACGGDDDGDRASDEPSTAAATSTAPPVPAATKTPPAVTTTSFTSQVFAPGVTLQADTNWEIVEDTPAVFFLEHIKNALPEEQAWVGVFIASDVRSPDNFSEAKPVPDDFTAWVAANRHLIVIDGPNDVTLDGIQGSQIDLRTDTNFAPTLFGLVGRPVDDAFGLSFRESVRLIELQDVEGGTIIVAGSSFNNAFFDEVQPIIEPVIASIEME